MSAWDSARLALDRFDVPDARRLLRLVDRGAPDYSRARLNLALLDAWSADAGLRERASRSVAQAWDAREQGGARALDARELAMAEGLLHLSRFEFPEACAAFQRAHALADDYHVWMGLGECRTRDTVALRVGDTIRFRSSYYDAAHAYVEAARRAPGAAGTEALLRLTTVAYTDRARVRRGWLDNRQVVLGRPIAVGDSFSFVTFLPGTPLRMSPEEALAHLRAITIAADMTRPSLLAFTRAHTGNSRVHLLLAELLEMEGLIATSRGDGVTALGEIVAARAGENAPETELRLAEMHLRLLVRAGQFGRAARLADTMLAREDFALLERAAVPLLGAALLTGRMDAATRIYVAMSGRTDRLPRLRDGSALHLPADLLKARATYTVAATLGVCDDEVRTAPRRIHNMLRAWFGDAGVPAGAVSAVLERPVLQAADCVDSPIGQLFPEPSHPLARMVLATDEAERELWRGRLQSMRQTRNTNQLYFESPENTLLDARLLLAEHDTAQALRSLGRMIDAIPVMPPPMLASEFGAGPLVRGMALYAELSAATGDAEAAGRMADAVISLWQNADDALQPVVQRMAALRGRTVTP